MKIDTAALTEIIDKCFDYSLDGRLTPAQNAEFLALGKRLRGSLVNLLSARFADGTQAVKDANSSLSDINTRLKNEAETLEKISATVKDIAALVGALDKLLGIGAAFI